MLHYRRTIAGSHPSDTPVDTPGSFPWGHAGLPMLWANLHLLFWLSLIPFVTGWMGENHFAATPAALYGVILLMAAIAYLILQRLIIASQGSESVLEKAVGSDWKGKLSLILYATAIPVAFVSRWVSLGLYVFGAPIWLVPDNA